ncbi:MAG: hypothetical protein J7M30_06335 [Deltaproteobacteria bacterium]|nr:hypothetical protein [Deltaproteobacteria bacterium]
MDNTTISCGSNEKQGTAKKHAVQNIKGAINHKDNVPQTLFIIFSEIAFFLFDNLINFLFQHVTPLNDLRSVLFPYALDVYGDNGYNW